MKEQKNVLGILLAGIMGIALLIAMALRTFLPRIILPRLDGIAIVTLSLIALVLDHYLAHGSRRDFRLLPLYAALIFGIFPWAACFFAPLDALKLALLGAVLFTVTTFLFDTIQNRLSSGPVAKAAPLCSAFGLYLAAQCLLGIV